MIPQSNKLADHLHYFLTCYLPRHKEVSPHTIQQLQTNLYPSARLLEFPFSPGP